MGVPHPFQRFIVWVLFAVLTLLIGHSAGSLAGGLARSLALAAAAVSHALLQGWAVQSLDMGHGYLLHFN